MRTPKISFKSDDLSEEGHRAKQETRELALMMVKEASLLWSREHKALQCGWLELAGPGAPTLKMLTEANALRPDVLPSGHFYGVDTSRDVLDEAQAKYGPEAPATWLCGDIGPMLMRDALFPDVGVLVYDSYDSVQGNTTTRMNLPRLARFARRQKKRVGEFLLVLNFAADPRYASSEDVDEYRAQLEDLFDMPFPLTKFKRYKSRKTPMYWTAIRLAF